MRAECLPHASVTVQVNGSAIQEYHVESGDAKTASCYVEAVSGAEFSVVLALEPDYAYSDDDLLFSVFIDGHHARAFVINSTELGKDCTKTIESVRDYADGFVSFKRFTFAQHKSSAYGVSRCGEKTANIV